MAENGALNFPIFVYEISPVDDHGPSIGYLEGLNMRGSGGLRKDGQEYLRSEQGSRQMVADPRLKGQKKAWEGIIVTGVSIWGTKIP
jgi:hypothetical protein